MPVEGLSSSANQAIPPMIPDTFTFTIITSTMGTWSLSTQAITRRFYDIYIYNNIFTGGTAGSGSVFLAWDTNNVYLYNNTFYNTISPMVSVTGATHAVLRNNIFFANNGQAFFGIEAYQGATLSSDHDLFLQPQQCHHSFPDQASR